MKQQLNIRSSRLTAQQLGELSAWWGMNQTEVITVIVDRAHRSELERRGQGIPAAAAPEAPAL